MTLESEPNMKLDISPGLVGGWRALVAVAAAAGTLAIPSLAQAQEVVVVNQSEGPREYRGPNWGLLGSGLIIFGSTYTASFVVAGTSSHPGDTMLYAPLVGPW